MNKENISRQRRIKWKHKNRKYISQYHQEFRHEMRRQIIKVYGGKCKCCGEKNAEFLSLDHIKGKGKLDRARCSKSPSGFLRYVIKKKYPKKYRLLCHNCNLSIGFYGYCPHHYKGKRFYTKRKITFKGNKRGGLYDKF